MSDLYVSSYVLAGGRKRENEDEEVGGAEQECRNDSLKEKSS